MGRPIVYSFAPGPRPFPWITSLLLKRKEDTDPMPYMIFFIAFSSFTFQIAIPFCEKDSHLMGKTVSVPAFPNLYHDGKQWGNVRYSLINMSSNELVRNESSHMAVHFNSYKKIK